MCDGDNGHINKDFDFYEGKVLDSLIDGGERFTRPIKLIIYIGGSHV